MDVSNLEEGSTCPNAGCNGTMKPSEIVGCSCHINPPCSACVDAGYECVECGWESNPYEEPEVVYRTETKSVDRSDCHTNTHVSGPHNSTPFTDCCGVAAINTSECPNCHAEIWGHDDGLSARRREVGAGNCLMCARPVGDISISGNCCC